MTIWRQHFFGTANIARIRTPSPPTPWFSVCYIRMFASLLVSPLPPTSPSPRGPPSNHREEILKLTNGPVIPPPSLPHVVFRQTDIWEGVHVGKERWGGGGGSYSRYICRAKEVLAPNRHEKFPVPLYCNVRVLNRWLYSVYSIYLSNVVFTSLI